MMNKVENRSNLMIKMHLECLRMNELLHHHSETSEVKSFLQDHLVWMHYLLKFYADQENIENLIAHYNWLIGLFNQKLVKMKNPIQEIR